MWTKCLKSTSSEEEPEIKNLVQMILQEGKKKTGESVREHNKKVVTRECSVTSSSLGPHGL